MRENDNKNLNDLIYCFGLKQFIKDKYYNKKSFILTKAGKKNVSQ